MGKRGGGMVGEARFGGLAGRFHLPTLSTHPRAGLPLPLSEWTRRTGPRWHAKRAMPWSFQDGPSS